VPDQNGVFDVGESTDDEVIDGLAEAVMEDSEGLLGVIFWMVTRTSGTKEFDTMHRPDFRVGPQLNLRQ
jgi:hypothetical protein